MSVRTALSASWRVGRLRPRPGGAALSGFAGRFVLAGFAMSLLAIVLL
jgi:hypothetical protein